MSFRRLLGIWTLLAVLMSANGIIRELALVPRLGARTAGVVSAMTGGAIILLVTGIFFRPLAGASTASLIATSVWLVGLTVAFEFTVGHWVDGKSWTELASNYAIWNGKLWPLVLALVALTPFIWGRWVVRRAA